MVIHKQRDDAEQRRLLKYYSKLLRPRTVLEVGSGYGRLAGLFANAEYVGIDRSRAHLKKRRYPNRVLMRAPHLGFRIKFDLVFSCTAIMLNPRTDAIGIIREMARHSRRYVLFLETRRDLHWAYRHPYELILDQEGFNLEEKINLRTDGSPLTLWLFKKRRPNGKICERVLA